MADVPISGLVDATTIAAADELAIVQGGVTKRIRFDELVAAITLADATTTDKGVARLATAGDALAGTVADEIITPATMKSAIEGGVLTKLLINGATGSTGTGDVNIPGSYLKNGVAIDAYPTNTPVAFTSASVITLSPSFSTYTDYELILESPQTIGDIEFSSNAGAAYTSIVVRGEKHNTAFGSISSISGYSGSTGNYNFIMNIAQIKTTAPITGDITFSDGESSGTLNFAGTGRFINAKSAPVDRIKITLSSSTSGTYLFKPKNKR